MASRARQLQSCQLAVCRSRIHIGPGIQKLGRRFGSVHEAGHMQRRPALGILSVISPLLLVLALALVLIAPIDGEKLLQAIGIIIVARLVVFRAVPSISDALPL